MKRKRQPLSRGRKSDKQSDRPSDWKRNDIFSGMPSWKNMIVPKNQLSPVNILFLFFDEEVIDMIVDYSNRYATLNNRQGDIQPNEMLFCYSPVEWLSPSRREMYWENASDSNNPLICNAMSRNRFRFFMQNIHCNDNSSFNKKDRFSKLRPLCDILIIDL